MITEDKVTYKLAPGIEHTKGGTEESLSDPTVPDLPLAAPTPVSRRLAAP